MFFKYYKIRKEKNIEEELTRRSQEDMMPIESLEKMKYPKKLEITNLQKTYPQLFLDMVIIIII